MAAAVQQEQQQQPNCPGIPRQTLGKVQLRHHVTKEIILIPTPSDDPDDPLNWPQWYKYSMAALICAAMSMCNFLAAGPSIAIVSTTLDFFPDALSGGEETFVDAVSKTAFFFTSTALLQGVGNFVWVPVANKFGRRPVYLTSYVIYLLCAVWLVYEQNYGKFLVGRILMGFGSGAAETIAPISIADVFFLHERGTIMALYTSFLSVGVAVGMIISGLITISHHWRLIYKVASSLISLILLIALLGFPETAYRRVDDDAKAVALAGADVVEGVHPAKADEAAAAAAGRHSSQHTTTSEKKSRSSPDGGGGGAIGPAAAGEVLAAATRSRPRRGKKQSYLRSLRVFSGTMTDESLLRMMVRPLSLIFLPPVLWAALVQSVTIGFLVAVSSNVGVAFASAYAFEPYQVGLCFVAALVGSLLGVFAGGHFSDWVADVLTRRNGGVREPEMRLPAMAPCVVTAPLALVLYGVGIEYGLHWMVPTLGLGLLNFSIAQGTNVCLVYVIDAYRPIAGEVTLTVMGFKSLFGFLLSFYTNPWVEQSGYLGAYGTMAGIAAFVILLSWPLYVWGKRIRHATWDWPGVRHIHWDDDREVGE